MNKEYLKLIQVEFMHGVEEPWCNNQGVAILPYVVKNNEYYYLLSTEYNPLFKNKQISDNGIEIVSKNNLDLKYKKICEDTIKILNLNEKRLVNYRFHLYVQYVRKKVPLDYAEIHPALIVFLVSHTDY